MEELFKEIKEFQIKTFPESTCVSKIIHLQSEVDELLEGLGNETSDKIELEYADCFLLLIGSAQSYGMTYEDVIKAIKNKLEINYKRKWSKPNKDGVVFHIKEENGTI